MLYEEKTHILSSGEVKKRIRVDKFISDNIEELSRHRVQSLIKSGYVSFEDGDIINDPSAKLIANKSYSITIPPPEPTDILPNENIKLDIVYEDDDLAIINKAAGITVHPGAGNYNDTLVNGLIAYYGDKLSSVGGIARPGIVHRLDKDTSGLMVIAKNDHAHSHLSDQLSSRSLSRRYYALCWKKPLLKEDTIETNIGRSRRNRKLMAVVSSGGKQAITHYNLVDNYLNDSVSLIECKLATGRTHQIRVHLSHIGNSIIGDPSYGRSHITLLKKNSASEEVISYISSLKRQMLHAHTIGFIHPRDDKYMEYTAELPDDMKIAITKLEK